MRKEIVVANWKMNNSHREATALCSSILEKLKSPHREVIIAPTYLNLISLVELTKDTNIKIASQNCHQELSGAYTGEVSASMLADLGLDYVILGHSERRYYHKEDNQLISKKVDIALSQGLKIIFCCGEFAAQRDAGRHFDEVSTQLQESLFHLSAESLQHVIIGYEPIWAVGTGITATSKQAQEMHAHIRNMIATQYGSETANNMTILYGGSCSPSNAKDLFAQKDVDGGLIGVASLNAESFISIVNA